MSLESKDEASPELLSTQVNHEKGRVLLVESTISRIQCQQECFPKCIMFFEGFCDLLRAEPRFNGQKLNRTIHFDT